MPKPPITAFSNLTVIPSVTNSFDGFYAPKLNQVQINAIPNSDLINGAIVYNTDTNAFNVYQNNAWVILNPASDVVGPAGAVADNIATFDGNTGKLIKDSGVAVGRVPGPIQKVGEPLFSGGGYIKFTGTATNDTGIIFLDSLSPVHFAENNYSGSNYQVSSVFTGGIPGTASTSVSALVELQTTTGALLLSRLTNTQVGALTGPVGGMMLYNATNNQFNAYVGSGSPYWGNIFVSDSSGNLNMQNHYINNVLDPINPTDGATKNYVDLIAAGFAFKSSCYCATIANLNATYVNGISGVGATLTNAGSLAAFSVDGQSPTLNARILIKNQTTTYQNGIYTLTTVGSGSVAWVLTRATDYDQITEIQQGNLVPIQYGTINYNSIWLQTAIVNTIGTDAITFIQFSYSPNYFLQVSNNLSDLASASTSRTNLGLTNIATQNVTQYNVLIGGSSNAITSIGLTNGQLLIGSTGANPVATLPTNGTNISWTAGAGSLTANLTGQISLANGGTNANLTASNGGIFYSNASTGAILAGTATASKILLSGSNAAPTWSTSTIPSSAGSTVNVPLLSNGTNYVLGALTYPNTAILGDTYYASSTTAIGTLSGNTTSIKKFLTQTGTGSISAVPVWNTIAATDIPASNLSGVNDSNITITVGTAACLLASSTLTMGWTGQLSLARGGTNANLTASNGGIFYSNATTGAILAGTATASQMLLSGSNAAPTWSTVTHPTTTIVNQILYSSANNVIAGLTTANSGVLVTSSGGVPSIGSTLPSAVQNNITSVGTISSGTWNGTAITVSYGGTGNSSATAYSVLCGGTTPTGALQSVTGVGTSKQALTSNGSGALPTWQNVYSPGNPTYFIDTTNASTYNFFAGTNAGNNTLTGTYNTGISYNALNLLTSGSYNIGIGTSTLYNNTIGTQNIAVGSGALYLNTNGATNVAIGYQALYSNTTASDNIAIGVTALYSNTTGYQNIAIGSGALYSNTTGYSNVAIGWQALYTNTGSGNTAIGWWSLQNNTSGSYNTGIGLDSLVDNTTGSSNVASGTSVLQFNTTGSNNVGIGRNALGSNTTASNNTAVGYQALFSNTTGYNNTAVGYQALYTNPAGSNNLVAFGYQALYLNTTGYQNTAVGYQALYSNNTGANNTAIGFGALYTTSSGYNNTAVGYNALNVNTTGYQNTAIGFGALSANTTISGNIGYSNTAVGFGSLTTNTTGYQNTGIGQNTLQANTTGYGNTAIGLNSSLSNTTGYYNSSLGISSLNSNTTGIENTAIGQSALYGTTTGSYNVAVGANAGGTNITGGGCTFLGENADASATGLVNACAIGYNSKVGVSNAVVLGSGCYVGIGKNSPGYALHLGTDNGTSPLFYMVNASSIPSAPATNDGIFCVVNGRPYFKSSGTSGYIQLGA